MAAFIAFLTFTLLPAVHADERDFPFTYEYLQGYKNEHELAYHVLYTPRENFTKHELEYEYGFSDRFSIAPYVTFESGEGRSLHYDAVKLEMRYRLGDFEQNRILAGLYAEFEQPNRDALETEGKLILSRYDRHGGNLSFNYIFERKLSSGAENEHSWSLGYARPLGKRGVRGGFEIIHHLNTGQLNGGPVVSFNVGKGVHLVGGYALPLNRNDDNRGEFRFLVQSHF